MNKKFSRFLTMALVLVMFLAFSVPAYALNASSSGGSTTVPVNKTLSMSDKAVPEDVTFTFNLAAADGTTSEGTLTTSGTDSYMVYAGITEGVTYAAAASNSNIVSGDLNGSGAQVTLKFNANDSYTGTGTKSLQKSFTIDFSGVAYTEPGVYRYKFTESSLTGYDTDDSVYYIDVYVEYVDGSSAEALTIGKIVVTKGTHGGVGATVSDKKDSADFVNEKETYDVTLTKTVTGNQGSRNQEFTFTVTLTDVPNGNYTYTGPGTATGTIAVPNGSATVTLKHGQTITINDLPAGAKWSIVENDYTGTNGGYTTTVAVSGDTGASADNATRTAKNETGIANDTAVTFTNTRNGTVPTGVLLTVAPFAALMAVGAAGVTVMMRKKRAEED